MDCKMKLIITLALLAISHARIIHRTCDLVHINDIGYEKEVLKENVDSPYQMAIDYNTNTLFFSYTASNPESDDSVLMSAYLNLETKEYNTIPGITGGFAATVDNNKHKVYLGGRNGIYEYDYATKKASHIDPHGYSIWQLFSKDTLYYTAYPQERVYTFENGNSVMIPELERTMVRLVALDNNHNIYFSNSTGLFIFNKIDKTIIPLGEYNVNSFTADINGNLYFSTPSGIYDIRNNQVVHKLAYIDNVFGVVVEANNNIIYGAGDKIIRLKPSKDC